MKEFRYLRGLFTSDGTMEQDIGWRIGAVGAALRSVYRTVVIKRSLGPLLKLLPQRPDPEISSGRWMMDGWIYFIYFYCIDLLLFLSRIVATLNFQ